MGNLFSKVPDRTMTINHTPMMRAQIAKVMAGGGRLTVRVREDDGAAVIRIRDTGPGIPPEVRERIFDPFFTTRDGGTGLGLSVSYSIIKAHDGEIEVTGEPGEGATFTVRLPIGERSE